MAAFVTLLSILVSILLIIIVLIQNPKGGGLSSTFGGAQAASQLMGAANSGDILTRATWVLAGSLFVLCIVASFFV
jgi:preprotein translocase subunit SecG